MLTARWTGVDIPDPGPHLFASPPASLRVRWHKYGTRPYSIDIGRWCCTWTAVGYIPAPARHIVQKVPRWLYYYIARLTNLSLIFSCPVCLSRRGWSVLRVGRRVGGGTYGRTQYALDVKYAVRGAVTSGTAHATSTYAGCDGAASAC